MPCHLCRDAMASCRHLNCSNVYRMMLISSEMSHPETLNCLLQDAMLSLQRWVILYTFELSVTGWLSLSVEMSHETLWTVCYRMSMSLCRDGSSWDKQLNCLLQDAMLSNSVSEMSHPETFELFVTGCHVSLQRWVILRHLNCLLQDAMLSLFRDESSWDIWTVCYRMPCLSAGWWETWHPVDKQLKCLRMTHVYRESMPCSLCLRMTQRWVILRHLNCLLQDAMSLCRDESSWDIWTVCYRMPCLSAEMSHPETLELFVYRMPCSSLL